MESNHQNHELPPKKEVYLFSNFSETQRKIYQELLSKIELYQTPDQQFYLNALMQLRKVCNHSTFFNDLGGDKNAPEFGVNLINSSGKMIILDKLFEKLSKEKHQVVVFSQMTKVLDILQDYCLFKKYNYSRIDGSMTKNVRTEQINEFTKPGSDKFVCLVSTRAGGLGIDFSNADTVILYDIDWNPTTDEQAIKMVYKSGKKDLVVVYRMITENSIEEKILEMQYRKQKEEKKLLIEKVEKMFPIDVLKNMIEYGKEELLSGACEDLGKLIDEEGIDDYLEKCEIKTWELMSKFGVVMDKNERYERED